MCFSARTTSASWCGGDSSRKILLTGSPSKLSKSTPLESCPRMQSKRGIDEYMACGTATPFPIPVDPNSSRRMTAVAHLIYGIRSNVSQLGQTIHERFNRFGLGVDIHRMDEHFLHVTCREPQQVTAVGARGVSGRKGWVDRHLVATHWAAVRLSFGCTR